MKWSNQKSGKIATIISIVFLLLSVWGIFDPVYFHKIIPNIIRTIIFPISLGVYSMLIDPLLGLCILVIGVLFIWIILYTILRIVKGERN